MSILSPESIVAQTQDNVHKDKETGNLLQFCFMFKHFGWASQMSSAIALFGSDFLLSAKVFFDKTEHDMMDKHFKSWSGCLCRNSQILICTKMHIVSSWDQHDRNKGFELNGKGSHLKSGTFWNVCISKLSHQCEHHYWQLMIEALPTSRVRRRYWESCRAGVCYQLEQ